MEEDIDLIKYNEYFDGSKEAFEYYIISIKTK